MDDRDEEALIERARTDRRAFAPLYLAHYQPILTHIYRRVGDAHAAQDIAAETFIRAMNAVPRYVGRGRPFRHWLLRIASNETNRHLRRAARVRRCENEGAASKPGTHVATSDQLDATCVMKAMHALSIDHQTVLSLHYFESLAIEEIAEVLGCRPGTVKSRLARARAALARTVARERQGE